MFRTIFRNCIIPKVFGSYNRLNRRKCLTRHTLLVLNKIHLYGKGRFSLFHVVALSETIIFIHMKKTEIILEI